MRNLYTKSMFSACSKLLIFIRFLFNLKVLKNLTESHFWLGVYFYSPSIVTWEFFKVDLFLKKVRVLAGHWSLQQNNKIRNNTIRGW